MGRKSLIDKFRRLSPAAQHLLELCAVYYEGINRTDLAKLAETVPWADERGKRLSASRAQTELRKLVDDKFLVKTGKRQQVTVNSQLADYAAQQAVRDGCFDDLAAAVEKLDGLSKTRYSYRYGYHGRSGEVRRLRDIRIAFYRGDWGRFKSLNKNPSRSLIGEDGLGVLAPFDQQIFDRLDPVLQGQYMVEAVATAVLSGAGTLELFGSLDRMVAGRTKKTPYKIIACSIDVQAARGDVEGLGRLGKQLGGEFTEASGCAAFLQGDWEQAEKQFDAALTRIRRTTKKKRVAARHLAGVFHVLLLLRKNTAADRKRAMAMLNAIESDWSAGYRTIVPVLQAAFERQETPTSDDSLFENVDSQSPFLAQLIAGYVWRWLDADADSPVTATALQTAVADYTALDFRWLAAEAAGIVGRLSVKTAQGFDEKSDAIHHQLQTAGLLGFIQPEAQWQRCLKALTQLHSPAESTPQSAESLSDERMIWELNYGIKQQWLSIRPFLQKRMKSGGWSKGRPVALERLYHNYNDVKDFGHLTEQDKRICGCLRQEVSVSGGWRRRYTETYYYFDTAAAARAAVGHPALFREGDRTQPLEMVAREPQLVVRKNKGGSIQIALDPKPVRNDDDDTIVIREDGPHRLTIITFSPQHVRLHELLGGKLTVPSRGESRVLEAVKSVAPLIAIHSEIGGAAEQTSEAVDADTKPHLHLMPYQDGVRAEFFVRPFGDAGPSYRPGEGGENVFAHIGGQPKSARRDLSAERLAAGRAILASPSLAAQVSNLPGHVGVQPSDVQEKAAEAWTPSGQDLAEFYFPTPAEALELLLELQPPADAGQLVIHWPQGKQFRIAGEATASQFRLNIRRDRDWFAASGKLKVDNKLSLDMMQLVDLIEATPSRFVQLENGDFLALTKELRRRIEELAAYSDRRKTKLRFPPIRAAALEDLGDAFQVKADEHWTGWVQRLRESSDLTPHVPSTFQAELREYQEEGYAWMSRLAHWGAGACLADDMGLGKTIQALALLLDRAASGPALVVAPTSVAFNWLNETARFAPTLNVRLFGEGDRDEVFQDLGPRDVVVCSYGLLHIEAERFQAQAWHTVILDEAQAIKNMATRRSKAAMGLSADFRLVMTGTPLENHLGELWNLFQFINPGLLGSYESFQQRFILPIERDGRREARLRLKKLIQPFILRRTKTQVLQELPSRTEVTLQVELSREEAAFYEALRRRAVEKLAEDDDPQHLKVLAEIMRLRRACCHPRLVMEDSGIEASKLAMFSETIDELLENKHKVLVFSQFVDHLTILRETLDATGVSYQYLDGSTTARQRKQRVEAFQAGQGDVFLISLRAGGLGLNLTAADYVIHMDPWWNPAVEDQASDRAHRLGQQRPVTIYRLVTQGTIEERIVQLHRTKRDLADSLLEGADASGKLSAEELLKLIRE